jgi:hypothetical protein
MEKQESNWTLIKKAGEARNLPATEKTLKNNKLNTERQR